MTCPWTIRPWMTCPWLPRPWLLVYSVCLTACLLQLASVLQGFMSPHLTNTVTEEIPLEGMAFPLILKLCVKPAFNLTGLDLAGYDTTWGAYSFFMGQSKFNRSIVGWAGHTNTAGVQGTVQELLDNITLFKHYNNVITGRKEIYVFEKTWLFLPSS